MRPDRRALITILVLAGTATLAACGGDQNALRGEGTRSAAINENTLVLAVLGGAVWVIVVIAVLVAAYRRNREAESAVARRGILTVVVAGVAIPAVIIGVVIVHSIGVLNRVDPRDAGNTLTVEVTSHQFWWEVTYPDEQVVTANEVHIPTGERVLLKLETNDVIHSFWVPALTGKMDLVPGETNENWVETDQPGTYWGQCAEFCGVQHARMRFVVVAHDPAEFDGWLQAQAEDLPDITEVVAADAADAADADGADGADYDDPEQIVRGREVFMSASCVYCHTIAGTEAQGTLGPDLTHLASREYLAAGTVPNERGHLGGWIVDPQSIKPGARMPGTDISGGDLQALLAFLESLE